jgi:hypothetical protein
MITFFSQLSWTQYLIFLASGLTIYYAIISYQYFRGGFCRLVDRFSVNTESTPQNKFIFSAASGSPATEKTTTEPAAEYHNELQADKGLIAAEMTIADIRALVKQLADEPHHPEVVKLQLQGILTVHDSTLLAPYRESVNHVIVSACEQYGIALLSENEVDEWW